MANPLPSQPAAPAAPPAAPPQAPGIVQAFVGVLTRPAAFYASVRDLQGLGPPIVFALVIGLVAGVVSAVYAVVGLSAAGGVAGGALGALAGFSAIVFTPVFAVIGCFVGGAIVHLVSLVAGGKGSYEQSVRVAAYAGAVMPVGALLSFAPLLGTLPTLYGLYLVAVGLITIHAADAKRAYTVMGVLGALLVAFSIMGMLATRAVKHVGAEMETRFGKDSEFQRDLDRAQQDMRRAAEEMRRAAEQGRQPAPPSEPAQPPPAGEPPPPPAPGR